jgi:hypothetical protein
MKRSVAILAAAMWIPAAANPDHLGKVTAVADGDTSTMEADTGRVRVRIYGIDARRNAVNPDTARPCSPGARNGPEVVSADPTAGELALSTCSGAVQTAPSPGCVPFALGENSGEVALIVKATGQAYFHQIQIARP